jgi:hypothetical protein
MKSIVLVAALAAAGCSQPSSPIGLKTNEVLLQVSATGRAEVRPDEARITVGVSSNGPTAAAASTSNNEAMNRVTAALGRLGIKPDDLQTRSVSLGRIDYGPERGRFRSENYLEVRVRDVRQAGPAIAAATEAGGNVVSGPDLRVSEPAAADNAAYAAAYKAARKRADAYAEAADLKVRRIIAIRDGAAGASPVYYSTEGRGASVQAVAPVSPPVQAGVSTREVQVHVDFALGG